MSDILDYITWRGDLSFEQSPFNEIDALILCQLSYINFNGLVNGEFVSQVTYKDLYKNFEDASYFNKETDTSNISNAKSIDLFKIAGKSERFGNIHPCGYVQKSNKEKGEQFAAITNFIGDGTVFVAFRGTDNSIVGVEEDLNLAVLDEIPSQRDALNYLKNAVSNLRKKYKIRVGGHSKGGNSALFACAYLNSKEKKSLYKIYNYDSPGFSEERLNSQEFKSIRPMIQSYYPKFSIIGMLFKSDSEYQVVDNDEFFIFQHSLLSWHVRGNHFITVDSFKSGSEFFGDTFNDWYASVDSDKKTKFVNTLFMILEASGAQTFKEFKEHLGKNSITSLLSLKNIDSETEKAISLCFKALKKAAEQNYDNHH